MAKKAVPEGIDDAGAAVWRSVTSTYTLRVDELHTLEDYCRLTDMIHDLDEAWRKAGKPKLGIGSMGQPVIHPLVPELKAHRMARNALWRQLKLPDDESGARPNQHRSAAQSRWAATHGAGA